MATQKALLFFGLQVPDADFSLPVTTGEQATIRGDRKTAAQVGRACLHFPEGLPGCGVPEAKTAIVTARDQYLAVWSERKADDAARSVGFLQTANFLAGSSIPEKNRRPKTATTDCKHVPLDGKCHGLKPIAILPEAPDSPAGSRIPV